MLRYYTDDIVERLSNKQEHQGWEVRAIFTQHRFSHAYCHPQEIEATLHCVMSIQEAVPQEHNHHLARLFSPEILGRLPTAGHNRVRRTTLGIIGVYLHMSQATVIHLLRRNLCVVVHHATNRRLIFNNTSPNEYNLLRRGSPSRALPLPRGCERSPRPV